MMNLVALGLLLSSLAAAGVWSPHPPEAKPHEDHHTQPRDVGQPFREGHRLIVFEYERQQVAADAAERAALPTTQHLVEESKERIKEAASVLPNVGQGVAMPLAPAGREPPAAGGAKNVICDAYGVCKEVVASLVGKAKEKTSEKTAEIEETAKETLKKASEEAAKLKEGAEEVVNEASGKVEQLKDSAKDAVKEKASKAKDKVESAMDQVSQIKEGAKNKMESTMDKASQVREGAKEPGQNLAGNISGVAKKAEHKAEKTATEVRGNLTDILRRANEVACDAVAYAWSPDSAKAVAAILHFLGFATAYGACVWVTFVSCNLLAAALPRQQFGMVQSKLYPVYFQVVAYAITMALIAHFVARDRRILAERVQGYNLLFALVMVLINFLFFEPKATKVMFERMKVEKEESKGRDMTDVIAEPAVASTLSATTKTTMKVAAEQDGVKSSEMVRLNMKLKRLNSYSSFLNILTLMSLSWHLVHLARQMQVSC